METENFIQKIKSKDETMFSILEKEKVENIKTFRKIGDTWRPKVILGDIRKVVECLPENFIDCIITSPPYWMQRDYNHPNQIGREETPEKYVEEIATIFENLRTKLKKTATIFLNVGYKYLNGELLLIPEMIALKIKEKGFVLKNKIIWWKPNAMPTPARDRLNDVYEPILFFIRDDGKEVHYFNIEEISERPKTLDSYTRLLSKIDPRELLGARVLNPLSKRETVEGKVVGVHFISNNPIKVHIKWKDNAEQLLPFGDPLRNYPEKTSFLCPLCKGTINYWNIILSFANEGKLICPECQKYLCNTQETFPLPNLEENMQPKNDVRIETDFNAQEKKYITKIPKNSKFLRANMSKISSASPAGRLAIVGEYLTIKRRWDVPQLLIAEYLRYWKKQRKVAIEDIDRALGYSYTAGHWFRRDFGWWGKGGSIPRPSDWIQLKKLLKFDDIYDRLVTEIVAVLQTVKPHEEGKNPGDVWKIKLEQYPGTHFSIFPTQLVENAIKVGCPPEGVVVDPFAGSGTVGEVAMRLNRKAILIELLPEFLNLIKKRCRDKIEVFTFRQ